MKLLSVLTSPPIYHIVLWLHAQVLPCVQKWLSGGNQKTHHKKNILAVGAMENTIKVDKPKKIWVIKGNIWNCCH